MEPPARPTAITLAFDEFGWEELRAEATDAGIAVEALIERAVADFVWELSAESRKRLALEVPDSSRGEQPGRTLSTEVNLSAEQLSTLEKEAERQGVPVPRLVEHAVFLYLAREDMSGETG